MYPLNLTKAATAAAPAGFALANTADEHRALTAQGYEPKLVDEPKKPTEDEKAAVMAALDAAGIAYDKRSGVEKLKALLPS